jgi:hypothetical protein
VRPLPPVVPARDQGQPPDQVAAPATDTPVPGRDELHERRERQTGSHDPVTRWLAGAAAAAVVVLGGVVWHPWDPGTAWTSASASQQVLRAGDARSFTDRSTTVVRSVSLGKAVVRGTLPSPPPGQVYELWLRRPDGTMAKAGLVSDVADVRDGVVLQGDAATATGAGITLEPAGGSDAPTSPLAVVSFT